MTFWQSALKWPDWMLGLVLFATFFLGIAGDNLSSSGNVINILALPVLLLLFWNVLVYVLLILNKLFKFRHFKRPQLNASQQLVVFRGTAAMHGAAATLALGVLLGMYWRGLVFDYQAVWQSTFLTSQSAHQFLTAVLTPAVYLRIMFKTLHQST